MLVQLDRMKKEYDGFSLELNMEIPENQVTGLIGANGAGKSTTFKLMLGLIRPDEGNVEIFGRNAAEMGAEDKQKIGAAFSDSGFSEYLKVQQLIPIMSRFYPDFQEEEFTSFPIMVFRPFILESPRIFGSIPRVETISRGSLPFDSSSQNSFLNSAEKCTMLGDTSNTYLLFLSVSISCSVNFLFAIISSNSFLF